MCKVIWGGGYWWTECFFKGYSSKFYHLAWFQQNLPKDINPVFASLHVSWMDILYFSVMLEGFSGHI